MVKKQSKGAFCDESWSKVAREQKKKRSGAKKYANCTRKVRFLSIFVQFCGVTSVAK